MSKGELTSAGVNGIVSRREFLGIVRRSGTAALLATVGIDLIAAAQQRQPQAIYDPSLQNTTQAELAEALGPKIGEAVPVPESYPTIKVRALTQGIEIDGNRVPKFRWAINVLIAFILSGLWHGANWTFIIWGALHGIYIITSTFLGKLINKFSLGVRIMKWKITYLTQVALTFSLVTFAWIFFRSKDVLNANYIATHLLKGVDLYLTDIIKYASAHNSFPWEAIFKPVLASKGISDLTIVIFAILAMQIVYLLQKNGNMWDYLSKKPFYIRWAAYSVLFWTIITFGEFAKKEFIYFAF